MVIICYGMIKSASTFTFQIIQELVKKHCTSKGLGYVSLQNLDEQFKYSFVDDQSDFKRLLDVLENSDLDVFGEQNILIKTHAPPVHFQKLISKRGVQIIANYRHPAEVALSLVDAAQKDKALGKNRFSAFDNLVKATNQLPYQCQSFIAWNQISNVHNVYYDDLVSRPVEVFSRLANSLNFNEDPKPVLAYFLESNKKIIEFNKGVLGRRHDELSRAEISRIEEMFPELLYLIQNRI